MGMTIQVIGGGNKVRSPGERALEGGSKKETKEIISRSVV